MGVMQRSLSPLGARTSSLRTPFVGAVIVLVCFWSLVSLDLNRVRSTVVCSTFNLQKIHVDETRNLFILE